jgi:LysM repeat protein
MASDDALGVRGGARPGAGTPPVPMRPALPLLDPATRSANPVVCPFFRREVDRELFAPLGSPDEQNVCAAIGVPKPQSPRQQELVCLTAAHGDCPRYLRGAIAYAEPPVARRATAVPRATLAALLVLVLSAGISFGFVVQRGGLELAAATGAPSSSAVAVVVTSPSPSAAPTMLASQVVASPSAPATATPAPTPPPSPSPSPSPSATPSASPSSSPSPSPSRTPKPTAKPTKAPTSTRYALLAPCPSKDGCWIYTVRSGDNLFSIAKYFGHPLSTIYRWNPQYPGTALKVGAAIRMPPPTR